jgi:hypothetical protein
MLVPFIFHYSVSPLICIVLDSLLLSRSSFCCLVLRFRCCESLGVEPTTFSSTRLGGVVHLLSSRLSACRVVRAALSRRGSRLEFSRLSQHRIFACRVVLFALRACTINYLFTFKYDLSFELET